MSIHYKKYLPATILFLLVTCATFYFLSGDEPYQPLHRISPDHYPHFADDFDLDSLIGCAETQIQYLKKRPTTSAVHFGTDVYSNDWMIHSTEEFISKLRESPSVEELNRYLKENYLVYQAGGRKNQPNRRMLITGYYEPIFDGSLTREGPYLTPIYARPGSLVTTMAAEKTTKITGRYDDKNNIVDYWSREEIETKGILKGYEIAYLRDPFDAFLLHVQGSGRIRLPDGSIKSVRFAASNGLTYNSIGKLLVDEGAMPLEQVNIPAIRKFLQDHPEQQLRILHHNPRYIFFSWGDNRGPRGSSGVILTPGRSVAMDGSSLPSSALGYLKTQRPITNANNEVTGWTSMNRFIFPQDSGAAIQGSGRLDMFWGHGDYGRTAANHMKEEGQLFFLVKKGYSGKHQ